VAADPRLPAAVRKALAVKFPVRENELVVYPTNYACPSAVLRDGRENVGITDVMSPWSGAVSEDEVR
jgi:gamma-glutamyltranspeptidase/glutathione hydrolase